MPNRSTTSASPAPLHIARVAAAATPPIVGYHERRESLVLNGGDTLSIATNSVLDVFGSIAGQPEKPSTIEVSPGATLFAAGTVEPSVVLNLDGADSTLRLAGVFLTSMHGTIGLWRPGSLVEVTSAQVTSAKIDLVNTSPVLSLWNEGSVLAQLRLSAWQQTEAVWAVPDAIDGTRLLIGDAPPQPAAPAIMGGGKTASYSWSGGTSGAWSDRVRWISNGQTPPGSDDYVNIRGPEYAICAISGDGAARTLQVTGNVALYGTFEIGQLSVGSSSAGLLVVDPSTHVICQMARIEDGTLQIAGAGSSVDVAGNYAVGGGLTWTADGGSLTARTMTPARGNNPRWRHRPHHRRRACRGQSDFDR